MWDVEFCGAKHTAGCDALATLALFLKTVPVSELGGADRLRDGKFSFLTTPPAPPVVNIVSDWNGNSDRVSTLPPPPGLTRNWADSARLASYEQPSATTKACTAPSSLW